MPANLAQLRMDGLTSLQVAELRSAIASIGNDYVTTLENPSLGGGKVGEPTALTVIIDLAPSVIVTVALWLAKNRENGRIREITITRIGPNGGMESFEIKESSYEASKSSSAAIQAFLRGGARL